MEWLNRSNRSSPHKFVDPTQNGTLKTLGGDDDKNMPVEGRPAPSAHCIETRLSVGLSLVGQ